MAEEQLRKAYGLMKQGQTKEALALVQAILKQDKNSVPAWWMMTNLLADDPERQKKALEKVLTLDPKHKLALQMQAKQNNSAAPKEKAKAANPNPPQNNKANEEQGQGLSWDKLEARDKDRKEVDEEAASKMVKTATTVMIGFAILVILGLALMWAIPAYQFAQVNNPRDTTLRFYTAFLSGDMTNAKTLVCADVQVDFDARAAEFAPILESLKTRFGEGAVLSYDLTGLTAEILSEDGTNATVQVAGQYTITAPNISEEIITSDIVVGEGTEDSLRNDNGVWCIAKIQ